MLVLANLGCQHVGQLDKLFEAGAEVNRETLAKTAIGKSRYDVLKILGDGDHRETVVTVGDL